MPNDIKAALAPVEMEWEKYVAGFLSSGGDEPLSRTGLAMLAQFMRSTPMGVMMLDSDGKIIFINDVVCNLFDHDRELAPDITWSELRSSRIIKGADDKEITEELDPICVALTQHIKMTNNVTLVDASTESDEAIVITAAPIYSDYEHTHPIGACATFEDVTDYKGMQDILYHQATHDQMTGLLNRSSMLSSLAKALARSKRTGTAGALLYMNIDDLDSVNEKFGHSAGDALLGKVAERLLSEVRDTDVVARLGGDEFAVLLSDMEAMDARRVAGEVADRMCRSIARPYALKSGEAVISVSAGLCLYMEDASDEDSILSRSDEAMRAAKQTSRGSWRYWDSSMSR